MRFLKTDVAWKTEVHLNGNDTAYATSMQVVDVANQLVLIYNLLDLILCLFRQTFFKQFARSLTKKSEGCDEDKHTNNHGCDRVKHRPTIAKQYGPTNANCRTY